MTKLQITHPELYEHIAATTPTTDKSLLLNNHSRFCTKKKAVILCTLTGAYCWFLEI
jgi:hypothetical protein